MVHTKKLFMFFHTFTMNVYLSWESSRESIKWERFCCYFFTVSLYGKIIIKRFKNFSKISFLIVVSNETKFKCFFEVSIIIVKPIFCVFRVTAIQFQIKILRTRKRVVDIHSHWGSQAEQMNMQIVHWQKKLKFQVWKVIRLQVVSCSSL